MARRGVFLVRFQNLQDKNQVLKRGVYHFDSRSFLVKGWNPNMDLCTEKIESLAIWIQLPDLDLKYWGPSSLSKICNTLGIPLKTDKFTKDKAMIRFARVMVDMKLEGLFQNTLNSLMNKRCLLDKRSNLNGSLPNAYTVRCLVMRKLSAERNRV